MYDVLLSAESAGIMQAAPSLAQDILSASQASAGSTSSSGSASSTTTSTQELLQELENTKPAHHKHRHSYVYIGEQDSLSIAGIVEYYVGLPGKPDGLRRQLPTASRPLIYAE